MFFYEKKLPYRKGITSQDVYNVKIFTLLLTKQIKAEGKTLDSFDFKPDAEKQLFTSLDDISDDFLDDAAKSTREVFYDFLNDDKRSFQLLHISRNYLMLI